MNHGGRWGRRGGGGGEEREGGDIFHEPCTHYHEWGFTYSAQKIEFSITRKLGAKSAVATDSSALAWTGPLDKSHNNTFVVSPFAYFGCQRLWKCYAPVLPDKAEMVGECKEPLQPGDKVGC